MKGRFHDEFTTPDDREHETGRVHAGHAEKLPHADRVAAVPSHVEALGPRSFMNRIRD